MKCNIIQDLLPSYIDGICSDDTASEVETHIESCTQCNQTLQIMRQPMQYIAETNVEEAKEPFKRINKKRRVQVIAASLLTFFIMIIGYQVFQHVGVVNQYFSPMVSGIVNITDNSEEWQSISFSHNSIDQQDFIEYDSIFWEKKVVNDANNESNVLLRVKDEQGNIIIDEFLISPGKIADLEKLKKNQKYYFEIKAPEGRYSINAV
ncbi:MULTISPECIES: anti-sigma factor family protein [Sporosarcina]|uniref:anti-sigma factor family protein n=1 Tax=Sporosarcina TaxID=1569 RepID=UPI00129AF113|nr:MULTISPECIES: zf-HC2 domain-containing protein [Sporosarcina]GKV67369.1 hypothetical protein NCCP2331_35220 [Sporosarcina sp. NCCP-2331]GLB57725.1 hypothetical protein NCCP2378_35150 [Sporosarcina sp. NCCP-2378]